MASILPTGGTCEKHERFFCSLARYEQKPLSYFKNPFLFNRNPSQKSTGQNWQKMVFEFFG
jgi:hypothetical protein